MIFKRWTTFWNQHGFITLVGITIIFFLLYWLFFTRHKSEGSYASSYFYAPFMNKMKKKGMFARMDDYVPISTTSYQNSPRKKTRQVSQSSKGERICKNYLEYIFERPFQKVRPPFLYNTVTSENLELDMYNQEVNLACEYQGRQHYEYIPFFHGPTRDKFQNQKYRDERKAELCRKNRVPLLIVPYTVPNEKIPQFIQKELQRLGVKGIVKK